MAPNLLAFPIAMLGIIRAGAAQVNVNPLYTPRELEHQLNDSGAETIVIFDGVDADASRGDRQDWHQAGDHGRGRRRRLRFGLDSRDQLGRKVRGQTLNDVE